MLLQLLTWHFLIIGLWLSWTFIMTDSAKSKRYFPPFRSLARSYNFYFVWFVFFRVFESLNLHEKVFLYIIFPFKWKRRRNNSTWLNKYWELDYFLLFFGNLTYRAYAQCIFHSALIFSSLLPLLSTFESFNWIIKYAFKRAEKMHNSARKENDDAILEDICGKQIRLVFFYW